MISLLTNILEADKRLFMALNSGFTHPWLDVFLPFVRNSLFWAPLYVFLVVFVVLNFGKKGLLWSLAFLCCLAITDLIGTYIFKVNVDRLRPCQDPYFFHQVRLLLKQCSGSSSFISNHAANHFGLSVFMVLTFRPLLGKWAYLIVTWGFLIAYAQVYVGVHYPLDVIAGGLVGSLAGVVVARLYHRNVGFISLER